MASRSSSARTRMASASGDGVTAWPETPMSELAIAAHMRKGPIRFRMERMIPRRIALLIYVSRRSASEQRSSTFSVSKSSARVRPRLIAAIGLPASAAAVTKR